MDHKVFSGQRLRAAAWRKVNEQSKSLSGSLAWCDAHTHQAMCHKQHFIFVPPGSLSFNFKKFFLCHRNHGRTVHLALCTIELA